MNDLQICITRLSKIAAETGKIIDIVVTPDKRVDVSAWTPGKFNETFRAKADVPIDTDFEDLLC